MTAHRYPLVAYLDPALTATVRRLQIRLRDLTGSEAALRDWQPHITLGSEVELANSEVDNYVAELRRAVAGIQPFIINIRDFGFIDNWSGGKLPGNSPYGVFLHVEVTPQLQALADAVEVVTATRKLYFQRSTPYQPHVTLAFRDLDQNAYLHAKSVFEHQPFKEQTSINNISVAKMLPNGRNDDFARIQLG